MQRAADEGVLREGKGGINPAVLSALSIYNRCMLCAILETQACMIHVTGMMPG